MRHRQLSQAGAGSFVYLWLSSSGATAMYAALGRVFLGLVSMVRRPGSRKIRRSKGGEKNSSVQNAPVAIPSSALMRRPDSTHLILEDEQFWTDAVGG